MCTHQHPLSVIARRPDSPKLPGHSAEGVGLSTEGMVTSFIMFGLRLHLECIEYVSFVDKLDVGMTVLDAAVTTQHSDYGLASRGEHIICGLT